MKMLIKAGHMVEFIPFRNKVGSREYQECIKNELPGLIVTENYDTVRESCDAFFMYADDYIWEFERQDIAEVFSGINAERKIMMLNYRRGKAGEIPWTRDWDKYMFLNSTQERELLKVHPGVKTKVIPPCTELKDFLKVVINYNTSLRIVRHSSQGDTKFYPDFSTAIGEILASRPDVEISMLPGPSFVQECARFRKVHRTASAQEIAAFLSTGNLFWYSLPPGYMDMGPRVILEAMAAGLPILADNWGGALDRVTPECGWLCDDKSQHFKIIKYVTVDELRKKGQAARERARQEFVPERYMEEILT
jgi:glycosyltransferase involved in cell wall biosynthesis